MSSYGYPSSFRMLGALLAVLAVVAAACGGNDDSSGDQGIAQATSAPDDQPVDGAASADAQPTATSEATDAATASAEDPGEDAVVLTDSFRGVTADTIMVGHTAIDFELLNQNFGLDLAFQDFRPTVDAIIASYNEQGGVLGRRIEVVHELFLPVGAVTAEEVCVKLTEDVEVFAVLNGFSGPGAEDVNECFPGGHDTILVGGFPTTAQGQAAGGLWVSEILGPDRRNQAMVNLMVQSGILDELGAIMVVGANPDEQAVVDDLADALRAAGTDVPATAVITTTGDEPATNAEVDVFIERIQSDSISTVMLVGEGELRNGAFFRKAPDLNYVMANGDRITDWQSIPPAGLEPETRVITNRFGPEPVEDPRVQACVDAVEGTLGVEVLPTDQLSEGEPNYWSGTLGSCRRVALFVQIAEAAGPDLTNESWAAALDDLADLSVPGFDYVSISSDKVDVADQLQLVEYNLATLTFDPTSEITDVS